MRTARQDAWTLEDDTVLAEIILRHVRTGSTQLNAFREAGQLLGRTDSACGFRWNAVVRKQFAAEIEVAKAERRSHKMAQGQQEREVKSSLLLEPEQNDDAVSEVEADLSWQEVLRFLRSRKGEAQNVMARARQLEQELQDKSLEVEQVAAENEQLRAELRTMARNLSQVRQDYLALLQILERARKEVYLGEHVTEEAPTLQVDDGDVEWQQAE